MAKCQASASFDTSTTTGGPDSGSEVEEPVARERGSGPLCLKCIPRRLHGSVS